MHAEISPELHAYYAFVKATLSQGGSIDEDATPEAYREYQTTVQAIQQAVEDGGNDDQGRPARELIDEARGRMGSSRSTQE